MTRARRSRAVRARAATFPSATEDRDVPIDFYSPDTQRVIGPVVLLPQKGSVSGGSKRPLNAYAVLRPGRSILFDAPLSWTLDGVRRLADEGHPPAALVLSHRDLAASGDAFEAFTETFDAPILLHREDRSSAKARDAGVAWQDVLEGDGARALAEAGLEVIHVPGHTPGSIMLYLADEGGILLAGDSAVGPGPAQSDRTPRLERPLGADEDPAFVDTWRRTVERLPLAAVLPLHGEAYTRAEHPEDFDRIVANVWNGAPMDPRRT